MLHKFEFRRQLMHILLGIIIVALYSYNIINSLMILILLIAGLFLSFLSTKSELPVISWFLKRFERQKVKKTFPGKGIFFYLLGVFLVVLIFDKNTALAAIMILALGDGISHIVGRYFGKTRTFLSRYKLIEGSIAGFVASSVGASLFVSPWKAIVASAVAMFVELIELKISEETVDDNLVVPLVAAATIYILDKVHIVI